MAEASAVSATTPPEPQQEVLRWTVGGTRTVLLSFLFLILLPFYLSIGPMLFFRLWHGLWLDTIGLGIVGLLFTVLMAMVLAHLVHSVRSRVKLDKDGVSCTLPALKRGPTPLLRFETRKFPYSDVAAVDTRSEVYSEALAPALLKSTRLTFKDGTHTVLGYVNEHSDDRSFPYPQIGEEIARRAGLTVKDHGVVRRSIRKRAMGLATDVAENTPVTADEIKAINLRHKNVMRGVVGAVAGLMLLGLAWDFATTPSTSYASLWSIGGASTAPSAKR